MEIKNTPVICDYQHLVEKLKKDHGGSQFICKNYFLADIPGRPDRHSRICEVHAKAMMAINPFWPRWKKAKAEGKD